MNVAMAHKYTSITMKPIHRFFKKQLTVNQYLSVDLVTDTNRGICHGNSYLGNSLMSCLI